MRPLQAPISTTHLSKLTLSEINTICIFARTLHNFITWKQFLVAILIVENGCKVSQQQTNASNCISNNISLKPLLYSPSDSLSKWPLPHQQYTGQTNWRYGVGSVRSQLLTIDFWTMQNATYDKWHQSHWRYFIIFKIHISNEYLTIVTYLLTRNLYFQVPEVVSGDICSLTNHYYNTAVTSTCGYVAALPSNVGKLYDSAVDAVQQSTQGQQEQQGKQNKKGPGA